MFRFPLRREDEVVRLPIKDIGATTVTKGQEDNTFSKSAKRLLGTIVTSQFYPPTFKVAILTTTSKQP